jgi:hypothetical protein
VEKINATLLGGGLEREEIRSPSVPLAADAEALLAAGKNGIPG